MIARIRPEAGFRDIFFSFFTFCDYRSKFENNITDFYNVKKIILTQSARSGLYFLFKSLPHEKVFIPSYTCWVVVEAARLANKETEFIDIRLNDFNIDVEILKKKITPGSIIVATHQFGIPCDIEEIINIANENNCYVIEDNAAGFGSEYKNRRTGSFAGAGVISFEFTKTLTCGRGGAVLFNDEALYEKVIKDFNDNPKPAMKQSFKFLLQTCFNKFFTQKFIFKFINFFFLKIKGYTAAVPIYQTVVGNLYINKPDNRLIKLAYLNFKRINKIIEKKRYISDFYSDQLSDIADFALSDYESFKKPVFMRFPIILKEKDKTDFYNLKNRQGLDLGFTFPYSCDPDRKNSPNSHIAADSVLNLPVYSSLKKKDISKIVEIVKIQE